MKIQRIVAALILLSSMNLNAQEVPLVPPEREPAESSSSAAPIENKENPETAKTEDSDKPASENETEDSKFTPVVDEDTPVTHDKIAGEKNLTTSRPWKAPDFSGQDSALGYSPDVFAVPEGLKVQVSFWIDIYSKYNSDQGVLHDSEHIDLIYDVLDFSSISGRTDLNIWQKEHKKIKMVKEAKKKVVAMLEKFHKLKDPSTLTPEEKKIWDYFEKINEPKKFLVASKKNRLRFQLGQKDRVIQGIYFSGRYIEEFERIFREAGLPIELTRLPFVESSYNVLARSKVGASGLWQIMPYTMKGFMKRDPAIDLRNHPTEATKLAAKLLRINYNMLQSWPLALTGYNHGPSGVLRLTKKHKTRDISELKMRFGFASRNFYASFLAILEVTSNATKYLGPVTWSQPLDAVDIKLPLAIKYRDLLRWFDNDDLKTQIFNPQITRLARMHRRPIPKGMIVSVSKAKHELVMKELESVEALKKAQAEAEAQGRVPSSVEETNQPIVYKIRRGDTLKKLAQEFGVPIDDILKLNSMKVPRKLRVGSTIKIP